MAVHLGSLIAVVAYFQQDIRVLIAAWVKALFGGGATAESKLGWAVIIGTVPAGLAGILLDDFIETNLRSIAVIAATTIGFGILLGVADKKSSGEKTTVTIGLAVIIGIAQAIALVPGTSRSGITMTAALLLGLSKQTAARFSFLLSIPLITAAGGLKTYELVAMDSPAPWGIISVGAAVSAITAFLCIHWFLKLLDTMGFMPFVIYRLLLGAVLLGVIALI